MLKQYVVQSDNTRFIIGPEDSDNDISSAEHGEQEQNRGADERHGFVLEIKFEQQKIVLSDQQTASSEVGVSLKEKMEKFFSACS